MAWAAGLFEGEGSIRISKPAPRNLASLCVDVPNTDESIVRFFRERWDGSMHKTDSQGRRRAYWRWRCSSRQAAAFLREIWPYLRTDRVRERARYALEFQAQKSHGRGAHTGRYRDRQQRLYERMAALNLRGVHDEETERELFLADAELQRVLEKFPDMDHGT